MGEKGGVLEQPTVIERAVLSENTAIEVLTDSVHSRDYDRVMPLFEDESLYLAAKLMSVASGDVLDLGTGSGVLALAAAAVGANAIGVDLNPRSVSYASRNELQNRLQSRPRFLVGDLYAPVHSMQFDLIVANPPFVPMPPGSRLFLSADGGCDGLAVVSRILEGARTFLKENGRLLILTLSLGDSEEPLVFRHLRRAFAGGAFRITTTHLYERRCFGAEPFFELFSGEPGYRAWRQILSDRCLTHFYYMVHDVASTSRFEHKERFSSQAFTWSRYSGSWAARLRRFRNWANMGIFSGQRRPLMSGGFKGEGRHAGHRANMSSTNSTGRASQLIAGGG